MRNEHQLDFSPIFFDTVFGLLIFFNIDTFLTINDPAHFIFYLFGVIIIAHWWLMFKSVDDYFGEEVTKSALDLVFGIIYIVCLAYFVHFAALFDFQKSLISLIALEAIDVVWALLWLYVGEWKTKNKKAINIMESDLVKTIQTSGFAVLLFSLNLLASQYLTPLMFVLLFAACYCLYIYTTFRNKVVDFQIF